MTNFSELKDRLDFVTFSEAVMTPLNFDWEKTLLPKAIKESAAAMSHPKANISELDDVLFKQKGIENAYKLAGSPSPTPVGKLGSAPILGNKIDTSKVSDTLSKAGEGIASGAKAVKEGIASTYDKAAPVIGDTLSKAGEGIASGLKTTGDFLKAGVTKLTDKASVMGMDRLARKSYGDPNSVGGKVAMKSYEAAKKLAAAVGKNGDSSVKAFLGKIFEAGRKVGLNDSQIMQFFPATVAAGGAITLGALIAGAARAIKGVNAKRKLDAGIPPKNAAEAKLMQKIQAKRNKKAAKLAKAQEKLDQMQMPKAAMTA